MMEQFVMNDDIRAQLKYYTAKLRRLQAEELPLEDTIAAMMYRGEDWYEQAEAQETKPPYLPGYGSETTLPALRMLAEDIITMVRQYNGLMSSFLEEPDKAAEAWLDGQLRSIQGEAARQARKEMIRRATEKLSQQLGMLNDPQKLTRMLVAGRPGEGKKQTVIGLMPGGNHGIGMKMMADISAAMSGMNVAAAVASPATGLLSGVLHTLGVIGKVVEGCTEEGAVPQPLTAEIELSEESKAIHAAILYLLSGDGCLPEAFDSVSLRQIVPMVCMTQEMQGICAQESQDVSGAQMLLTAAWEAGIYGTVELLLDSGLRSSVIQKALENPGQTLLAFQAACCIMPVITSEIIRMDQAEKAQLVKNMSAFYQCLNKLTESTGTSVVQLSGSGEKLQHRRALKEQQELK